MEPLSWWANGWMKTLLMLNQILRWLKKRKVLRLLCLASSVVGLICYALSSSVNHLLGDWSWWKMLLYIVFSFIICLAVLFTPKRSRSTSLLLEAHLAFLVLIITSVYSFFIDNVEKSKPDAYSLISSAAFATMCLGLSNLTPLGFQIDLVYFFCGDLIIQLMKIKLWLVIVGVAFSYSLIQFRDYPRHTPGLPRYPRIWNLREPTAREIMAPRTPPRPPPRTQVSLELALVRLLRMIKK